MDTTTDTTSTTMATFDDFDTTFVGQLDASANLVEYQPTFIAPVPASPPETPPPVEREPPTEPPALLRRRIPHRPDTDSDDENGVTVRQFVRTFRAESDTESDEEALPVPTSPLMRQVACAAVVSDAETEEEAEAEAEAEEAEAEAEEAETEADEAEEAAEAEEEAETEAEAEEEVELQQGTPETIIEIPRWLFATTLIAMLVYILFAVYLLTLRCDGPARY